MSFRQTVKDRRWLVTGDGETTHLLMDGTGKLCVPDSHAGMFLNLYFASAIIKGERLSVVEQKTPIFRLFFDLDIRLPRDVDHHAVIQRLSRSIWRFVLEDFFVLESSQTSIDSTSVTTNTTVSDTVCDRMIVCTAPLKTENNENIKAGCHLVFPNIYVNSPIALRCREVLLKGIDALYTSIPHSTSAQSVTQSMVDSDEDDDDRVLPLPSNSWSDVIDDSVYRGSGLRMVWSNKGRQESRPYVPVYELDSVHGWSKVICDTLAAKREYVHDCSIRSVIGTLTACRGGEHQIADTLYGHIVSGTAVSGRSQAVDVYAEVLPIVENTLPPEYRNIRFLKAFVTSNTIYLKTNSRYCMNVKREHRTSTVYIAVTRQGMMVRCYSRKEEYSCANFASPLITLPTHVMRVFFPDSFVTSNTMLQPSNKKKKRCGNDVFFKKSPLFTLPKKKS